MDIGTISSQYTKAPLSLVKDRGQESRAYDNTKMLADSFSMEPELRDALSSPIVSVPEKMKLLTATEGIGVCELYTRFINPILAHKRETLLPFIAYIYIHLYRKEKKITRVRSDIAVTADDVVKFRLQGKLWREAGCTIKLPDHVEPELIGDFRLRVGNYQTDISCTTQLRDICTGLFENG